MHSLHTRMQFLGLCTQALANRPRHLFVVSISDTELTMYISISKGKVNNLIGCGQF